MKEHLLEVKDTLQVFDVNCVILAILLKFFQMASSGWFHLDGKEMPQREGRV